MLCVRKNIENTKTDHEKRKQSVFVTAVPTPRPNRKHFLFTLLTLQNCVLEPFKSKCLSVVKK